MTGFEVCQRQCSQCLFSPEKIVSDERKRAIIQQCLAQNRFFLCHKAQGREICCRGFYDTYGDQINLIRIAQRLRVVQEVSIEEEASEV